MAIFTLETDPSSDTGGKSSEMADNSTQICEGGEGGDGW